MSSAKGAFIELVNHDFIEVRKERKLRIKN